MRGNTEPLAWGRGAHRAPGMGWSFLGLAAAPQSQPRPGLTLPGAHRPLRNLLSPTHGHRFQSVSGRAILTTLDCYTEMRMGHL